MITTMKVKMALIAVVASTCLLGPIIDLHAQIPELYPTADPTGEKPTAPRDAIPVPVIPDKMAVPAPTVVDKIQQATPPAEMPGPDAGSSRSIPRDERKEVVPPVPTRVR
jgi:hypothetical protein